MHTTPQNSVITGVVVAAAIGDSDAIVFKGFTKGVMILQADASSPTTTVNYYVSSTEAGTYYELKNSSGAVSDTVAFLFIQNTDASNHVYLNLAAGGTAAAAAGNIYVQAGETWYARLTSTTVANLHAISSTSTVTCIVVALLDDISA
jgi:hypothetical protein